MPASSASAPVDQVVPAVRHRVLVVDDEASIRDLVTTALEFVGFDVRVARDGYSALAAIGEFAPELVVLDVSMPGVDGLEVCRRMRADRVTTPVIFLTARDGIDDTVAGFGAGGDDYLTKPFHLKELTARIHAVLKRVNGSGRSMPGRLACAGIEIDEATRDVWSDSDRIAVSPTEYKLLRYLLLNAGIVVSKAQILEHVWQFDFGGDASVVETYMSTLRRKVDRRSPKRIHTVRGFGYVIREEPDR
jgi:two-component system OmpR family response regulator